MTNLKTIFKSLSIAMFGFILNTYLVNHIYNNKIKTKIKVHSKNHEVGIGVATEIATSPSKRCKDSNQSKASFVQSSCPTVQGPFPPLK